MQFVCLLLVIVMMTDSSQKCIHKLGFELQSLQDIVNCKNILCNDMAICHVIVHFIT